MELALVSYLLIVYLYNVILFFIDEYMYPLQHNRVSKPEDVSLPLNSQIPLDSNIPLASKQVQENWKVLLEDNAGAKKKVFISNFQLDCNQSSQAKSSQT